MKRDLLQLIDELDEDEIAYLYEFVKKLFGL